MSQWNIQLLTLSAINHDNLMGSSLGHNKLWTSESAATLLQDIGGKKKNSPIKFSHCYETLWAQNPTIQWNSVLWDCGHAATRHWGHKKLPMESNLWLQGSVRKQDEVQSCGTGGHAATRYWGHKKPTSGYIQDSGVQSCGTGGDTVSQQSTLCSLQTLASQ